MQMLALDGPARARGCPAHPAHRRDSRAARHGHALKTVTGRHLSPLNPALARHAASSAGRATSPIRGGTVPGPGDIAAVAGGRKDQA